MYSTKELAHEVATKITHYRTTKTVVLHPIWIAQSIADDHPDHEGGDADFYSVCALEAIRTEVRQQLNRFKLKPEAETDPQLVLEGFERLQEYYICNRHGVQVAVRLESMSAEERHAKITELEAMAAGCQAHADELRRYMQASAKGG